MKNFPIPAVVVSKCLGFDACRYNGEKLFDSFVDTLKSHVRFIPVCPEVSIGLGIPREPIRIVEQGDELLLYQPATGKEFSSQMKDFSSAFLNEMKGEGIEGFLLKSRSPSCGLEDVKIYNSTDPEAGSHRGQGFFGNAVKEKFPLLAIEDEKRLLNFAIREHFLIRLFVIKNFHDTKRTEKPGDLVRFHTNNKLLFMGYNESAMREMGSLTANHEKRNFQETLKIYEALLSKVLDHPPNPGSMINVLQHAFGGLSAALKKEERHYFLNLLEEYRDERIPLSVPIHLLEAWAIGQGNTYLIEQSFLHPYPPEILRVTDSGKGRV